MISYFKMEMNIILSTTYLLMNFLFSHPSKSSKLFWRVVDLVWSLTLNFQHSRVLLRNKILLATSYMIQDTIADLSGFSKVLT